MVLIKNIIQYNYERFISTNPYTLETKDHLFDCTNECEKKIEQLHNNHLNWQSTSVLVKKAWLNSLAENLTQNKDTIALAISNDMGKPITESLSRSTKMHRLLLPL